MERASIVPLFVLWSIFTVHPRIYANVEGDALYKLRQNLKDPHNVMQSWDPTLVDPCSWFHVTCNAVNYVTRVDLGNAKLSGQLVVELGNLGALQYLELYDNHIDGSIPNELGNLANLESLDLYGNSLKGPIPSTLGKLKQLRFLRLNNNHLNGTIPMELTKLANLQLLDITYNDLQGCYPSTGIFTTFTPLSIENNPKLRGPCK